MSEERTEQALPLHLRRIHRAGWVLFVVWATTLVAWGVVHPAPYADGWRLVLELMFVGRAVSIADGITSGFSNLYLLIQNGLEDIILLLILYPWIVTAFEKGLKENWIGRRIENVRKTAEGHKKVVESFGVLGLWVLVFFPFWSTGALVGGVVGYLLGMRTWIVFTTVFLGHVISVVSLIWFFDAMAGVTEAFDNGLTRVLPLIVLAALIVGTLLYRGIKKLLGSA